MIVTLTGAYRNAGDHLIGDRAHRLLRRYVDEEIVSIDRSVFRAGSSSQQKQAYKSLNDSKAVILCGGPAYQSNIYPGIYPIDLDKIETKVVPLGLGWKGGLNESPQEFRFSERGEAFVRRIHDAIELSSCRDNLTKEVLCGLKINNVAMTGCPAWYNLDKLDRDFEHTEPKSIVVSDAALNAIDCIAVLRLMADKFPQGKLTFALHHGFYPQVSRKGARFAAQHMVAAAYAKSRGYRICNISSDLAAMKTLYDNCDLHVGYRVHAHIYCLSGRTSSLLIAEDSRGVAQSETLLCPVLMGDDDQLIERLDQNLSSLLEDTAGYFAGTLGAMRAGMQSMQTFLRTI